MGDDPQQPAREGEAADDERAALVARVREELDAARRRVRDAWAQYQERAHDEHTREAIALSPVLTALLGLVS
jgi:ElaB/YqjD/DUF883 family membrane-anchored ribosome-binding protein